MNSMTTNNSMTVNNPKTAFDNWRSIVISLYMTLVGYGVLVGIPVISTAWVNLLGFSEVEVGRVAGADLGGLSLGAVLTAFFIARVNRRLLVFIGIAIAVLANGLCIKMVEYEQVLWLRLLAGIGSGIYTAVAVASLGASSKPARAYNLMLFAFAFSQAAEMQFLPMLSMEGIYWVFIVCFLITVPFVRWIPAFADNKELSLEHGTTGDADVEQMQIPKYVPWLCLIAIAITYINIGAYWTYIELAALADQATPSWVSKILVWASFCSLVGCAFATVLSNRFGLIRPLLVALLSMALAVGLLANGITDQKIFISVFSFNFLWIFVDVYQMSTIANVDKTGRFASIIPAAQGVGQIIGPNIAASLLGVSLGYSAVFILGASAGIVALLIYAFIFMRFRKTIPSLAYAK